MRERPSQGSSAEVRRAPGTSANSGIPAPRAASQDSFDTVLRGYDRRQVDERVTALTEQLAKQEENNRVTAAKLAEHRWRAERAERELGEALSRLAANRDNAAESEAGKGFGYRAERILRMAETEAGEVRAAAVQEAAELVAKARAEAEAHRHEIEQNLIMRATALDQQATEVAAALREREKEAADELTTARRAAEELRASARRDMDRARQDLEAVAQDVRNQAERWAEEHRAAAARDVEHLVGLRDTVHHDLVALSATLLSELDGEAAAPEDRRAARPKPADTTSTDS